jgi:hypothetical protein
MRRHRVKQHLHTAHVGRHERAESMIDRSTWLSAAKCTTPSQPVIAVTTSSRLRMSAVHERVPRIVRDVAEILEIPRIRQCIVVDACFHPGRCSRTNRMKLLPMNPHPPVTRMRRWDWSMPGSWRSNNTYADGAAARFGASSVRFAPPSWTRREAR